MEKRPLGKTGLRVSEIALGCEGFVGKTEAECRALFDRAFAAGVNCMDLFSPDPALRSAIGALLRGRREQFVLQAHLCTIWKDGQYEVTRREDEVRASFCDLLERLGTDYLDIGMIHYVDSVETWKKIAEGPVLRFAREEREKGHIRCLGLSSHNPEAALAAVESGAIDVLMFSVNP